MSVMYTSCAVRPQRGVRGLIVPAVRSGLLERRALWAHLGVTSSGLPAITFADMQYDEQDAVRALILQGLAEHLDVVDPELNADLNNIAQSYADGRTIVRRVDRAIVATGTILPRGARAAEIVRMSVRKTNRRSGVGRLMVSELVSTARGWGASKIVLETSAHWYDAVAFYQSNGFSITHHSTSPYGLDAWLQLKL